MIKNITCIECPKGCVLVVEVEKGKVIKVAGNDCPKGEIYAASEIENPMRIFTSTVLAENLSLKMVPVRTDPAIPKAYLRKAAEEVKKIRLKEPLTCGSIIERNFLGSGANLLTTRDVFKR